MPDSMLVRLVVNSIFVGQGALAAIRELASAVDEPSPRPQSTQAGSVAETARCAVCLRLLLPLCPKVLNRNNLQGAAELPAPTPAAQGAGAVTWAASPLVAQTPWAPKVWVCS